MRPYIALLLAFATGTVLAETPQTIQREFAAEAVKVSPGFKPSAQRGEALYRKHFGVSEKMPACTSCHTESPLDNGRHAITGKPIKPLAPAANSERLNDAAKVEKWFGRNCKEVVGRPCSADEKADFMQFLLEAR